MLLLDGAEHPPHLDVPVCRDGLESLFVDVHFIDEVGLNGDGVGVAHPRDVLFTVPVTGDHLHVPLTVILNDGLATVDLRMNIRV